jgi:hypothetical protein
VDALEDDRQLPEAEGSAARAMTDETLAIMSRFSRMLLISASGAAPRSTDE